jgi:hypothetical protein
VALLEHGAGDAGVGGDADLADLQPLGHPREQLVGLPVVEEQRAAVGVEQLGGGVHEPGEQQVQVELAGQIVGELEDPDLLAQAAHHQVEAAEERGVLVGRREM